jgi:integrase
MAIHNLDDTTLRNAKEGVYSDGGNLYLRVRKSGSKAWVFRHKVDGKPREIGVGPYPAKSLAKARKDATKMREYLADGKDPAHVITPPVIAEKKTFKELAADHIAAKSVAWRNAKHAWQWSRTLEMFVYPTIGKLTPDKITTDHILRILSPMWSTKLETATRVRQRIEAVMSRAITLKMRDRSEGNPAAWKDHLEHLLASPKELREMSQPVVHHPAIKHSDLSALLSQLRTVESVGSYCLQFISMTAVRSGEARGATWDEFDLLSKTWTIPASRMKMNKPHIVPLSAPAMAILRHMMQVGTQHVFASPTKPRQPISDIAVITTLHRLHPDITVHGMRSAFRDWCSEETNFPREVVEMSLAHAIESKTEAAYFRSDLLEKRRALMDTWAVFLVGAEVSPLKQVV